MMSPSITDDRNAQLTTQLENLEKRLKAMEKRHRIVRWSLQHCAAILESLQTKKSHCLLATIYRLVLARSFYCGLVRKYVDGQTIAVRLSRKIKRTSDKQSKQQNNTYNGRNKSPQFPPRLEYVDVLQQDHPVWSQVSNSLGDSLLRAKQHAVMLHYMCLRAAEERDLIQADLQNGLLHCRQELGLFEEALASLG
ncbi:hypothetical protein J4Q44_G00276410 [Coregonus suidteri]|uniref:Uncharacterized protein n=1 Tax=Coregonus suidteri TaxID=861788 RepID=A0AAN8L188_9TELE